MKFQIYQYININKYQYKIFFILVIIIFNSEKEQKTFFQSLKDTLTVGRKNDI